MATWRPTESEKALAKALPAPPRRAMVHWYDPGQLLSTGVDVLISAAMGRRSDYRLMEDTAVQGHFDYGPWADVDPKGFCFDFLADTGDGWNSTYAVAALAAEPTIEVGTESLPRGRFLVLGGDEVYPVASRDNYQERLVIPFETAFPAESGSPRGRPAGPNGAARDTDLFAIPGNHDWYDGLVSFSRLFGRGRRIGEWQTLQRRSYFALKLPHRWWLWGVDVQLEADIDVGQLDYFKAIATRHLRGRDRVILASAAPDWIYGDIKDPRRDSNLAYLEEKIIEPAGARVYLWVAGDIHHYRRHEHVDDARFQRIISGGGGAYLSSSHQSVFGPSINVARRTVQIGEDRFEQQAVFPTPATSWRLSLLNFFFLARNWRIGLVTGLVYATLTWLRPTPPRGMVEFFTDPVRALWAGSVFLLACFFAFYSGTGRDGRLFRLIGGALHAGVHVLAALTVASLTAAFVPAGPIAPLWRFGLNFLGGALAGPVLLGAYLMIGANIFGAYTDEAFSGLRIQDYKHFLRFRIGPRGTLEIFPIGIERVPRDGEDRCQYRLIEGPITIDPTIQGRGGRSS
jgi:hypothetical protein